MDAGVVLKVLAESHGDDKLLFLLEHPAQGEHGVLPPVPALHFQQGGVAQQVDGRFKQVDAGCSGVLRDGEGIPLVTAGGLALEVPYDAPQGGVAGLALPVPAHEYGVVIGQTFIQAPGLDAVVDHIIVNAPPMKIADNMGGAPAGLGKDQFPGFLLLWPGLRRRRRGREVRSRQGLHCLGKGKALDFNEIVQGCFPADFAGEPVPFSVADLQAVMLTGAVGASAHMDELVRVIPLEIGQQVPFLSLSDLLRGDIAHPTVPPAGPFPFQPV